MPNKLEKSIAVFKMKCLAFEFILSTSSKLNVALIFTTVVCASISYQTHHVPPSTLFLNHQTVPGEQLETLPKKQFTRTKDNASSLYWPEDSKSLEPSGMKKE